MYDIFVVGTAEVNDISWSKARERFPNAQKINNCKSFDQIAKKSFTKMFWVIWDDLLINDSFNLLEYRATKWDDRYVHVFRNGENKDGICLFPKTLLVSQREFDNRFFVEKKELDIQASTPIVKKYDIVFISYYESNADINFQRLLEKESKVYRINGIKGIHQAHISAAELSSTELFYVVDGDAYIVDDFNFDYVVPKYERNHVHVWKSRNPINHLEYGYGGVKLLPREKTLNMKTDTADMTTSISNNFKSMNSVSNITTFNTDSFSTWKSAFRECAKLASGVIARQESNETIERLDIWCNVASGDYADFAIKGAIDGRRYGEANKGDLEGLKKINDFDWLRDKFNGI